MPTLIYEVLKETKHRQEKIRFSQAINHNDEHRKRERKLKTNYFLSGIGIALLATYAVFSFYPQVNTVIIVSLCGVGLFALITAWII